MRRGLSFALAAFSCLATAQSSPWRYDLRSGDHLTYRYTSQRETRDEALQSRVEARFQTHVLVMGRISGQIILGFQRNRESADLTLFKVKEKDRLSKERPEFQKRMQRRPSRFSEAMEISSTGVARYPWEMARESPSHILSLLHEVMTLPPVPVKLGEGWEGRTALPLDFRWVGDETLHGKPCHRVEAGSPDGALKLTYWWSPESGILEQIEMDGSYSGAGAITHEIDRMELEARTRDENTDRWLNSAETRQGALQAMLLDPGIPLSNDALAVALGSGEARSQALALAIAARRRIPLPPSAAEELRSSANPQLRELAQAPVGVADEASARECAAGTQSKVAPEKFGTTFQTVPATNSDREIPYLLRVPLTYREDRPSPLLIYLSGGAGLAMDGVNTAEDVVAATNYLVLYPHAADYWWKPDLARRFNIILKQVLERYNVDRNRIYLTGFSNGGTGSLYFASLWPQRFAAVVSLMGAGQCMDPVKQGLSNLENVPLLFVHGERDPLIAPTCSTSTHAALSDMQMAFKPQLHILPNREHDITLQSDDGLALDFFKDKVRNPFPKHIDFSFTDAQAPRNYWIEILEGQPGKSGVEARVKADNTVSIRSHDVKRLRIYLHPELLPKPGTVRIEWNGKQLYQGSIHASCAPGATEFRGDPQLDSADRKEFSLP